MKEVGDRINAKWRSWLQPLPDTHLYSDFTDDVPTGNRYYLYGFMAVAVFTLLVACINYMNLATARAAKRAKEVGIRKILGSNRRALILQFLAESMLLAVVAVLVGLLLVKLAIAFTPLDQLFGKTISLSFTETPQLYLWLAGLALLVGLGAGLYPAFYLSAAVPVTALVGGGKGGGRRSGLRETLVFAQFLISVTVIACTLVMFAQMRYISSMSLGFARENRVNVVLRGSETILSADAIRTQLLTNPEVLGVSWMNTPLGVGSFGEGRIGLETNDGTIETTTITGMVGAAKADVGSPWAIGAASGGHKATITELGSLEDFARLRREAAELGIEIAIDIAYQCSPDHPYVREHPEWFLKRADGTVQYAENPPKKYQDIYPFYFETTAWRALWQELKSVVDFWIEAGVRVFRVDNPHTKPFPLWEWLIGEVRSAHPDVIFLSEAFTRPKVMYRLAKLGFSQSYTYFTWRNTRQEIEQYLTEVTRPPVSDYFRPSLWPNTPDILPEYLQFGGRPAFMATFTWDRCSCGAMTS